MCMDSLEAQGRAQYWRNAKIRENYQMLNGIFLRYQYEDVPENEYVSIVQQAQQMFERQLRMHHFDFISQLVNTLCGELEGHPDTHKAKAVGDTVDNARVREKARLLKEYVDQQIDAEINAALIQQGLDPQKDDFKSDQEAQAYNQQVEQAKQALTPAEIQQYISSNWQHVAEIWANITLEDAKKRYDIPRKLSIEFRDMLASDHCFRHFYFTGTGFSQETWNPAHVFYTLPEDQYDVEKGDSVGRTFFMPLSDVIDKFGHVLSGDQLEELYGRITPAGHNLFKDWAGNKINYSAPDGTPYGVRVPWRNPWFNLLPQVGALTEGGVNQELLFSRMPGMFQNLAVSPTYQVTEAYWKSQKRIGRLTWFNPESGMWEKTIVDETVVLPEGTKEVKGNLVMDQESEPTDEPTIEWTWINEVWGGLKITPLGTAPGVSSNHKPIYANIKPLPFQGKPDAFIYEAELPVVGSVFNARNAPSQSLVDLAKPYQIAFNLFMNQAYVIAEEEILPFLMLDVNAIPGHKDWSGPEGFEKWVESIRSLRFGLADTRPNNLNGANPGGQLPQVINLDATQRMLSRVELAKTFKSLAMEQIGISPQRLSDVKPTETATGVQTAVQRSYTQTASIFSKFYHYVQRTLKKTLDYSQFVQSKDQDITVSAIHSDYSNSFLKLNGTELLTTQLHVYTSDAQEDQRALEIYRQLALENNTVLTSMSDRGIMATSNSIQKIREVLENSDLKQQQQQQTAQQLEAQKVQQAQDLQKDQQAFEERMEDKRLASQEKQAYIKTFAGKNNAVGQDLNQDGTYDVLEYEKLSQAANAQSQKASTDQQKLQLQQQQLLQNQQQHQDKLQEAAKDRVSRERIAKTKEESSRLLGDKSR